jgi:ABC-type Mn2+/Zn2+ transport system permease subunit
MVRNLVELLTLFPAPVLAGVLIACTCAVLGVFVILKRVVFIGVALSEASACGVAAAMTLHLPPFLGAAVLTLATVSILAHPFEMRRVPRDAVLGFVFVMASSLSVLLVAGSGFGLHEVQALLYGDLILATGADLLIVLATTVPVLAYLLLFMRPTIYTFLDRDAAVVMGLRTRMWEFLYFLALGLTVSAASKTAGALLVFCFLVVPPTTGLLVSRRLRVVLVTAVSVAVLSTLSGLYLSFSRDWPTNQTIALVSGGLLVAVFVVRGVLQGLRRIARAPSSGSPDGEGRALGHAPR